MRWKRGNRLVLVNESQAPARTRQIFEEIRARLGVPVVPALYRAFGFCPMFLELHWQAFQPVLESRRFFQLGARLAAEAYTRAHNYFEVPGLSWRDARSEMPAPLPVSQVLDYYHYLDPLLLLVAIAQMQAFEGPADLPPATPDAGMRSYFQVAPALLSDEAATPDVRRVWEERRRMLELAFVSDEHRALACWPEFYQEYWSALKRLIASPLYPDCQCRIGESAWGLARELPPRVETSIPQLQDAGLSDDQISSLTKITEALVDAYSGLLLDITFAKIGCEGGTRPETARVQRQSGAGPDPGTSGSPTRAA